MRLSLLVPCYNEEKTLEACIKSCLKQTRKFDELVFVDDASTDKTPQILAKYSDQIIAKRTSHNSGNKSHAQEFGLQFITGDVMVTTDADTMLDKKFAEEIEKSFQDPEVAATCGYVRSIPHNWLTLSRAFEYVIGQNIHKLAQSYIGYIFVMPGAASAFRMSVFRKHINFDHNTITEDLDFTYKLHHKYFRIVFNRRAISYTQDPTTLYAYVNQMRRWYGGGWQNLLKHRGIVKHPIRAFELSMLYAEGIIFSLLLFIVPIINPWLGLWVILAYLAVALLLAIWAAWREQRWTLLLAPVPYMFLLFVNSYVYLEQFVKEVILRRNNLVWYKPDRVWSKYS